jgi:hypothetical protein
MMESPVTAKATDKVEEALKTVSRLRVLKWEPQAQSRVVGLDPAAITATFTVEEQVPVAKEAPKEGEGETEEPAEPAMETKTTVHTLHLSNLSPIGEDTKTYVRVGDAPAVATIMKTVADKLKPVMGEWREMRLITDDVPRASKIELTVGGESAVLNKNADGWQFEGGGAADDEAVSKLLEAVQKLQAVVFVESPEASAAQAGLASPRATIAVTIPGVEGAKRITIGGYTDEQTKRMAYVRRDDADALAKVMEAELAPLLRGPSAYQNRTVLSIAPAELRRFAISRVNPFTKERENVALELVDGAWQMKEPIGALGRQPKAQELVDAVAALQAERVVPAAEAAAVSQALQEPDAVLTITHQPASASPDGAPDATVEAPAPEATKTLAIAVHNGKPYGKLADRPSIYELPGAFVEKTKAEYRDGSVLKFNPEEVTTFSVKEGAVTHTFARGNDKWTYEAEPDLPLDHSKVENLLGQFQNLSTDAFVVHATADQGLYGLPEPEREIRIEVAGGKELVLSISGMSSQVPAVSGRFAASSATPGVFVLSESVLQALRVDLDALGAS